MTTKTIKTMTRLAAASAVGLFMSSAAYAGGSIGGDCCADLEERVAELEATTARKGNRKVSLEVSGHVNKALLVQDFNDLTVAATNFFGFPITGNDGDLQIIDSPLSGSRFRLKGSAKITSDLYAGYLIEFGVAATTGGNPLSLRHNVLYVGSKTLGKLSLGHSSAATDGIAEIDLSGTGVASGTTNISNLINLDGDRTENIRYDSPTLAGFKVSASWEENEDFDVAVRYGASLGDFTIAAGIGYSENGAEGLEFVPGAPTVDYATETLSGSISALHVPTGLNLTFAAGEKKYDTQQIFIGLPSDFESDFWYVKAGIKRKIFAAGASALSVDYHKENAGALTLGAQDFTPGQLFGIQLEREKFGVQFVQNIDAAAMELYVSAWTVSSNAELFGEDLLEEDGFMTGARIKF